MNPESKLDGLDDSCRA